MNRMYRRERPKTGIKKAHLRRRTGIIERGPPVEWMIRRLHTVPIQRNVPDDGASALQASRSQTCRDSQRP